MLLSDIRLLLQGSLMAEVFKDSIKSEISAYRNSIGKKRGYSAPVYLTEDVEYFFGEKDIAHLEKLKDANELDEIESSYIADALLMSEKTILDKEDFFDRLECLIVD